MQEPTIGILGGMGPEATVNCFAKLIQNTPAPTDQDHLRIVVVNNPKIPDRTRAILEKGFSPLPLLMEECKALQKAGADFIIIPCVTAHFFVDALKQKVDLPILSILDVVVEDIVDNYPNLKKIGLMGTDGTINSGIFQNRLAASGLDTVISTTPYQRQIMAAIYDIKSDRPSCRREEITHDLANVVAHLVAQGAQGVIAGCTEIPLALTQDDVTVPYFDSLLILARAAIRRAGREPISHKQIDPSD